MSSPPFDLVHALLAAAGLADDIVAWPGVEAEIFAETNAARRRERRAAFGWYPEAAEVARRHAADMLRRGYFDHKSPEGRGVGDRLKRAGVRWRLCAENIYSQPTRRRLEEKQMRAFGTAAVTTWLRSPGHRRNLLSTELVRIGVGVAATSRNVIAVQVFVA